MFHPPRSVDFRPSGMYPFLLHLQSPEVHSVPEIGDQSQPPMTYSFDVDSWEIMRVRGLSIFISLFSLRRYYAVTVM